MTAFVVVAIAATVVVVVDSIVATIVVSITGLVAFVMVWLLVFASKATNSSSKVDSCDERQPLICPSENGNAKIPNLD
jgi:heme/copper-type cytochrome/quinol oxidase subunit 2